MKIDTTLGFGLAGAARSAREVEAAGYAGVWANETSHDPFGPLALAAEHTARIELGTGVAVAFSRNPMTLANLGYDLQAYSEGRFILGLGSDTREHIEERFGVPWSPPVDRMREFVLAIRAIWDCWNNGTTLDFRGDFYSHTLMTPRFDPGPNPYGTPRVFLTAHGEEMTELAGEVADGVICAGLMTPSYLRSVTIPALERGLARASRPRSEFEISCHAFVVTGTTEAEIERVAPAVHQEIAIAASAPANRAVLDHHGWAEVHTALRDRASEGAWERMTDLIDDEILNTLAVVDEPQQIGHSLHRRYGEMCDRVVIDATYSMVPARWDQAGAPA